MYFFHFFIHNFPPFIQLNDEGRRLDSIELNKSLGMEGKQMPKFILTIIFMGKNEFELNLEQNSKTLVTVKHQTTTLPIWAIDYIRVSGLMRTESLFS